MCSFFTKMRQILTLGGGGGGTLKTVSQRQNMSKCYFAQFPNNWFTTKAELALRDRGLNLRWIPKRECKGLVENSATIVRAAAPISTASSCEFKNLSWGTLLLERKKKKDTYIG